MAINWPIPSSIGETYIDPNGSQWRWNGKAWISLGSSIGSSGTSGTSGLADRYNGTSTTQIVIPGQDSYVTISTQRNLAFIPGQTIYLYNDLITNYYLIDDYVEDLNSVYILGEVDNYDRSTGSMSLVVQYAQPIGGTYSQWYLTLTGERGLKGATGSFGSSGTSGESGSSGSSGSSGESGSSGSSGSSGESGSSGSSGTSGENGSSGSSGTSGTSGTSPSTDLSLSGNLSVAGLSDIAETSEVLNSYGATASTVTYDFSTGAIWYHGTASTNYTADFTNLPITNNRAITATILISQGSTGYSPTTVKIDGVTKPVKWAGGTYSVSTNKVDVIGFTFIRTGSDWAQVLGQINSFS